MADNIQTYSAQDKENVLAEKPLWAQALSDTAILKAVDLANGTNIPPCLFAFLIKLGKGALSILKTLVKTAILALDAKLADLEFAQRIMEQTITQLELLSAPYENLLGGFDLSFLFAETIDILQSCEVAAGLVNVLNGIETSAPSVAIQNFFDRLDNARRKLSKLSKQITAFTDQKEYLNDILNAIDRIG